MRRWHGIRRRATIPWPRLPASGGRELAALAGAVVAARYARVPVMLDGFACTAAGAIVAALREDGLDHPRSPTARPSRDTGGCWLRWASIPCSTSDLRLGEASGAALGAQLVRMAVATHNGMATFASAGVSGPAD